MEDALGKPPFNRKKIKTRISSSIWAYPFELPKVLLSSNKALYAFDSLDLAKERESRLWLIQGVISLVG